MFTGLIQAVCTVKSVSKTSDSMRITIDLGEIAKDSKIGDSIAINGTCLTITRFEQNLASFDISGETLARSVLAKLKPASIVNVEQALKATDHLGGHFVQGHIDGTATIKAIKNNGRFHDIKFSTSAELLSQMIVKGSVAADGISLTIAQTDTSGFSVAVIPQTWENTNLKEAKVGDIVNIETDMIVKTIKKQLENMLGQESCLTIEKLKKLGF